METTCESISVFSSSNLGTRGVGSFTRPLIGTDRHEPKSHSNFVQARGILLFACEDLCKVCECASQHAFCVARWCAYYANPLWLNISIILGLNCWVREVGLRAHCKTCIYCGGNTARQCVLFVCALRPHWCLCGIILVVKYANDDVHCLWALIDFD